MALLLLVRQRHTARQTTKVADTERPEGKEQKKAKLMFSDSESEKLVPEYRDIEKGSMEQDIRRCVEELVKGPVTPGLAATLPAGTRLNSSRLEGGTLVLDFSEALLKDPQLGSSGEMAAVFSIVNTMAENFGAVKRVRIIVDGRELETLYGHVSISGPLEKMDDIMGDPR